MRRPQSTQHEVVADGSPLLPLTLVIAGACFAVYLIQFKR
jgi:hypothetical protein